MGPQNRIIQFGIVIVLTVILQLLMIVADSSRTPVHTAEAFIRNYFYLDPAMEDQLCAALSNDGEAVADYLYTIAHETAQRGFSIKYERRLFTALHIKTINRDDTSATMHVAGKTRTAINPVYMVIGKLFHLGEYYPVDMTLDLVKEGGEWRVCGGVAGLNI